MPTPTRCIRRVKQILMLPIIMLAIFVALWAFARGCHYGQLYLKPLIANAPSPAIATALQTASDAMTLIGQCSEQMRDWLAPAVQVI